MLRPWVWTETSRSETAPHIGSYKMPMNYSLVIEPFDCWGFDFMGPFPPSHKYTHILVVVDYVTKWVEEIPTESADHKTSLKMLKDVIFPSLEYQGTS